MPDTIDASFGLDLAPLRRGFAEAKGIARSGASDVASAMNQSLARASAGTKGLPMNWANVQRQSFDQLRRQLYPGNFGSSYPPARPGQYAAPQDDSDKRGRFSLPAGFGRVLTLAAAVREVADYYERANEEAGKLRDTVTEITHATGTSAFRGVAEMRENLHAATVTLDEIHRRDAIESQRPSGVFGVFGGTSLRIARHIVTGTTGEDDRQQVARLRAQASKDISDMGEKQETLNDAQRQTIAGSERQAALLRAEVGHREKLGELAAAEAAAGVTNSVARAEENNRAMLEQGEINQRFNLRQREVESESRLNALKQLGYGTDVNRLAALRERIQLLQREAQGFATDERRAEINKERLGLQAEVFDIGRDRARQLQRAQLSGAAARFSAFGDTFGASVTGALSRFNPEIVEANRNANPALANELRRQAYTDIQGSLADELSLSSKERADRLTAQRNRERKMTEAQYLLDTPNAFSTLPGVQDKVDQARSAYGGLGQDAGGGDVVEGINGVRQDLQDIKNWITSNLAVAH